MTSKGIQKRYFEATNRRKIFEVKSEYLLIKVTSVSINDNSNSVNADINSKKVNNNTQSKVKESKVNNKNNMCKADALALFEYLWKLYPIKRGKGKVSDAQKMKLFKIGLDEMSRAMERYKQYVESVDYLSYQNGSTFFNGGYVDYLDANYVKDIRKKQKNSFNNFPQREYDFEQLESILQEGKPYANDGRRN